MMVVRPEELVEPFARSGADNITFHIEATDEPESLIDLIKSCGCKVGVSIKPKTSLAEILPDIERNETIIYSISFGSNIIFII